MSAMSWIREACRNAESTTEVYERFNEFCQEVGSTMSQDTFKRRVRDVFYDVSGQQPAPTKPETGKITTPRVITEAEGPNITLTARSSQIRTLEELLQYVKADTAKWKVTRWVANPWGSPENENFQVKAWLSPKVSEVDPREEIDTMLADAAKYMPEYPSWDRVPRISKGNLLELSLFDHHYGQLSWGKETRGGNYDTRISRKLALESTDYLLSRGADINIDRILLPIGNDFFNVNNQLNTTVHGTPQSEDDRWQKTFVRGRRLWIEIIERCLTMAPVDIIGMPGNHDAERSFYLVDSLLCWFNKHPDVNVNNGPQPRKYYQWGKCMLGFAHGNKVRKGKGVLVNLMATEQPLMWAHTIYREMHKGHLHATSGQAFQFLDEELGVRERVLPSLVALDDYHSGKGYNHLRESLGMVWNKEKGNTDIFAFHP